ncbi:MAG TPA: NAD(+) kinase [Peptococcaceae bacterium]|nr:MAG: putative inorganic polyphosphate/ATP-NAD kinase [Clostridia bacterium 41_269]HBT20454.1 NAD(+) kinase [Peptococcaceae bacterium]
MYKIKETKDSLTAVERADKLMECIGIILNVEKPKTIETARELYSWLKRKGLSVFFLKKHAEILGYPEHGLEEDQLADQCDCIITLGGDGTLLYTARITAPREKPILGINLGDFGFLVAVEPKNMYESLENVLSGNFYLDRRMMLEASVYKNGKCIKTCWALNDVVIAKPGLSRLIKLETYVAGEFVSNFPADGLIISSPTGSTAYNLSAGGPIVSPKVDVIILNPICPHTLVSRPLVISPEEEVRIILKSEEGEALMTVDGQVGFPISKGDEVYVKRAPFRTNLISLPGKGFYEILRNKLGKVDRNG